MVVLPVMRDSWYWKLVSRESLANIRTEQCGTGVIRGTYRSLLLCAGGTRWLKRMDRLRKHIDIFMRMEFVPSRRRGLTLHCALVSWLGALSFLKLFYKSFCQGSGSWVLQRPLEIDPFTRFLPLSPAFPLCEVMTKIHESTYATSLFTDVVAVATITQLYIHEDCKQCKWIMSETRQ